MPTGPIERPLGGEAGPPNKRMKLTSLSAAPGWLQSTWTEVPPRAPAGRIDGVTGSQVIRGVRRTRGTRGGHWPAW